jgi:hypothetical protein
MTREVKYPEKLREYYRKWAVLRRSTDPIDQEKVIKVVTELYLEGGSKEPTVHFCLSPNDLMSKVELYCGIYGIPFDHKEQVDYLGKFQSPEYVESACQYDYLMNEEQEVYNPWLRLTMFLLKESFAFLLCTENVFVIDRPVFYVENEKGLVHCEDGPAIEWGDGSSWFAIDGHWLTEEQFLSKSN